MMVPHGRGIRKGKKRGFMGRKSLAMFLAAIFCCGSSCYPSSLLLDMRATDSGFPSLAQNQQSIGLWTKTSTLSSLRCLYQACFCLFGCLSDLWEVGRRETGSYCVALAVLELDYVDPTSLDLTEVCLPASVS